MGRGLTQRTFVSGDFAPRASPIEMSLTNAAHVVLWDVPPPSCDRIPLFDVDSHAEGCWPVLCCAGQDETK